MSKLITGLLVTLVVLLAAFGGYAINKPAEIKEVPVERVVIVEKLVEKNTSKLDEMASDYLEAKYDEKLLNETAKSLVLSEKDKKDFKLAILSVLEAEGKSIDSYKDLVIYSFKIKEVELGDEDAEVIVELKVKGVEDSDEELEFKVKLKAVFQVTELVKDDNFEDAEVEYEIEFVTEYD